MRRSKNLWAWLAVLVCAALVASACGSDDGGADEADAATTTTAAAAGDGTPQEGPGTPAPVPLPERTKVTLVASYAIEPFAPLLLADAKGEFEKENLDVDVAMIPSNEATVQVATGRALLQVGGVTAAGFNAIQSGTGIRYVANVHYQSKDNEEGLWVRKELLGADGEIDEAKIPGMKVALGSGGLSSVSTIAVEHWLEDHGHTVNDIEPVSIGGPDMLVALEQSSIDAGYLITPIWQQPSVAECCVLVTSQPPLAASVYVVNKDALAKDHEVMKAVFRALMRTVRTYLQGDYHANDEVMSVLADVLDTPVDVIRTAPSLRFDPNMGLEQDILKESQEIWIDAGDILQYGEPMPVDQIADTSVIDELIKE